MVYQISDPGEIMRNTNNTLIKMAILAVGVQDIGGGAASPALVDIRSVLQVMQF